MTATGTLSVRALARLMGVSEKAIRKARAIGVFSDAAIRIDERGAPVVINATLAVDEWEKSGRQLRGSPRRQEPPAIAPAGVDAAAPGDTTAEIDALLARVRELRALGQVAPAPAPAPAAGAVPGLDEDLLGAVPPADSSLVAAQRIAMIERGRKLKLENDERQGLLIEASKAAREGFEFARALRENVLNVPARLSAELAAESSAARVYTRLDAALRQALEATAAMVETAGTEQGQ